MREIAHIRATMLGRFALQQTGMKEPRMVSLAGRSGRLWTLVAYLILHRDRGIPAQELIALLWPDGSGNNPASTLQNNASRARNAMATLGFSDTKGMIRYENGLYRWVPGTDTWLDVDVFEDLARRALETSDPEELRTLGREAADLYQGGFSAGCSRRAVVCRSSRLLSLPVRAAVPQTGARADEDSGVRRGGGPVRPSGASGPSVGGVQSAADAESHPEPSGPAGAGPL